MLIHIVEPGENVYSIAQEYNISPRNLISNNGLINPDRLVPGQSLIILVPETVHEVAEGETLYSISRYYNTTPWEIMRNNPFLGGRYTIIPGQELVISYYTDYAGKADEILVIGCTLPDIDSGVLRATLPYLTYVTVFGYRFSNEGVLIAPDDQNIINITREGGIPLTMNISAINPDGTPNSEMAGMLLTNPIAQNALVNNIVDELQQKGYNSLNVDFPQVMERDRFAYGEFIENLSRGLNTYVYPVIVQVTPKTSASQQGLYYEGQDYETLGQVANAVVLMPREEIRRSGPPMAIMPAGEMEAVLNYAVTAIRPEKLFIAIPNYALDWRLPYVEGETQAVRISNEEALQLAADMNVSIQFDEEAQAPFFEYRGADGARHVVWFQDARSVQAMTDLVERYDLRGISVCNIMDYYQPIWSVINDTFEITKIATI